jgi:hypothetical protein
MNKRWQIYYTAVLGALGGVLGWWGVGALGLSSWNIWVAYPIIGAGLGLFIGGCIAAADGVVVKRVAGRALRDGLRGALAGALLGLLGLLVAEVGFLLIGGGWAARTVGWALLGSAIGLSDLLVHRQRRRALYAAFGGLLGGALGGVGYEALTQLLLNRSDDAQLVGGGIGLLIVGACIGALIPLARQVLARAELRVLSGEQGGLVREVTDTATIGRYDGCDVYLPDRAVAWRHLHIRRTGRGFNLEVAAEAEQGATVDGQALHPGQALTLRGGEQILVGDTRLEFVGR